jgi:hypothetical protein
VLEEAGNASKHEAGWQQSQDGDASQMPYVPNGTKGYPATTITKIQQNVLLWTKRVMFCTGREAFRKGLTSKLTNFAAVCVALVT